MLWKCYSYYEDRFKQEFTVPPNAKMPLAHMPQATLEPKIFPPTREASRAHSLGVKR